MEETVTNFRKINFRSFIGFAISGFLLWLTVRHSGLQLKDLRLSGVEVLYFIAADIVFIFSIYLYSIRAKVFWQNNTRTGAVSTFASTVIGNFYSCLLPGNLGDGVRAWHFGKKNRIPFIQSLCAIFAEKWIDALFFVLLIIGLLAAKGFYDHFVFTTIIYTGLTVVILMIIYFVMQLNRTVERKLMLIVLFFGKPGKLFIRLYWFTSRLIRDLVKEKLLTRYLILCVITFTVNILQFRFLLTAAGVAYPVGGLYGAYLIAITMMIVAIIPSAPSNIGVLHYGLYSALIMAAYLYHIDPNAAALQSYARFAIYTHLSFVLPEVTIGAYFLIKERGVVFGNS